MFRFNCFLFLGLAVLLGFVCSINGLNLTVIHNNDFHTRYMPIRASNYAECEDEDQQNNPDCVGGAARTVAEMKHLRETEKNILFLNAGDHFQGTFWYTIKKSEVVAEFVSLMKHDVMALGNHEFDDGEVELKSFIDKVSTNPNMTILSCNLQIDPKSTLFGRVENSTIRIIEGIEIAIIGYTTPDTKFLSKPGNLVNFRDEIESINEEIARLKAKHPQLKIFIAVGHSGFERDKEIGRAIAELDLIVGGHTNTFLYTGTDLPSREQPEGDYPYVVKHSSGEQTLIVQAFAYGKYLGKLNLVFNEQGKVEHYEGQPIFLNASFNEDEETKKVVDHYNSELSEDVKRRIGFTSVDLVEPEACRGEECNIANVVADSFAAYFENLRVNSTFTFRSASECNNTLALVNGGNIRSSISRGNITYKSAISTLPFANSLGLLQATGAELTELFRHSATQYKKGGFMQVSGFQVSYKMDDHQLELEKLEVKCQKGTNWQPIDTNVTYLVVLNNFIANGGDNYTMLNPDHFQDFQFNDFEIFVEYIENKDDVAIGIEDRIKISKSSAGELLLQVNLLAIVLIHFFWNKHYKTG